MLPFDQSAVICGLFLGILLDTRKTVQFDEQQFAVEIDDIARHHGRVINAQRFDPLASGGSGRPAFSIHQLKCRLRVVGLDVSEVAMGVRQGRTRERHDVDALPALRCCRDEASKQLDAARVPNPDRPAAVALVSRCDGSIFEARIRSFHPRAYRLTKLRSRVKPSAVAGPGDVCVEIRWYRTIERHGAPIVEMIKWEARGSTAGRPLEFLRALSPT